jgi:hypothetical protein
MGGRLSRALLTAAGVLLAACGEQSRDVATAPEFAGGRPSGCNFTDVSAMTRDEFGNASAEAGWALDAKLSGSGTDGATFSGYKILRSIEYKFDAQTSGNSVDPTNASQLTVQLLKCMNVGGAAIPEDTIFRNALRWTGAFGVRGLGGDAVLTPLRPGLTSTADTRSLSSHDGSWVIEPPGTFDANGLWSAATSWQVITSVGSTGIGADSLKDALLVYGRPSPSTNFTKDQLIGDNVFDWSTRPIASFGGANGGGYTGVTIGQCTAPANFLQHNPSSSAEVLGYVKPSCFKVVAFAEPPPRTFAERLVRFLSPAPLAAAAATTTSSGGSKGSLSPFGVIFPGQTVLVKGFNWSKSGNYVNQPFKPLVNYQLTSAKSTKFLQSYILVWLEATNNQGSKVAICNNWAYTNSDGFVSFPAAYLNKAGGYTITTRTAGAFTITPAGFEDPITIPSVPPSGAQVSPLINVKNDTGAPTQGCESFIDYTVNPDGTSTIGQAPAAPGPNGQ